MLADESQDRNVRQRNGGGLGVGPAAGYDRDEGVTAEIDEIQ